MTLPTATPLDFRVTTSPTAAVVPYRLTRAVGVSFLLRLSVLEVPVSEASTTSGVPGAYGAVVSTVTVIAPVKLESE